MRVAGFTVEANKIVDPAQTFTAPFTAAGIVLNVAVWPNPSSAKSNEKPRKILLKNLIRMCIRRYTKKGSFSMY
jgi:hypothetical protein